MEFPDHPFWDFSLKVYLTDGVPEACIVLQDRHTLDVNIVLFCCWLGASGRGVLSQPEIARMTASVGDWNRDIVCALRMIRRRLKDGMPPAPVGLSEPLRGRIQKVEVDIEHVEQLMLAASVDRVADDGVAPDRRAADAVANIAAYLDSLGVRLDGDDCRNLEMPLRIAFPEVGQNRITELCLRLKAA